jgi:hypothetical protein
MGLVDWRRNFELQCSEMNSSTRGRMGVSDENITSWDETDEEKIPVK